MPHLDFSIRILSSASDVLPFAEKARAGADTAKSALGFLPGIVYTEAAEQQKLLIALADRSGVTEYAGHLMHGGVFPQARIVQTFVVPKYRLCGVGKRLIEALLAQLEAAQFMSVVAQVADDLKANRFWDQLGFPILRTRPGGKTKRRSIHVRIRELNAPRLFNWPSADSSVHDLRLSARLFEASPTFVLDLNILIDIFRNRAGAAEVGQLIEASFTNTVRLAIAEEFVRELKATSVPNPTDHLLLLAMRLPMLPAPPHATLHSIASILEPLVFPASRHEKRLRKQDQSDLFHLATAIHHNAAGFVTNEKAILRARPVLNSKYSLDVISPRELAENLAASSRERPSAIQAMASGFVLEGRQMHDADLASIEMLMQGLHVPTQIARDALKTDIGLRRVRTLATCNGEVVAFGCWDAPSSVRHRAQAFVCVNEEHLAADAAINFLLHRMVHRTSNADPVLLELHLLAGHLDTARIAGSYGFRTQLSDASGGTVLHKVALNCPVWEDNWAAVALKLKRAADLVLPQLMPDFATAETGVPVVTPNGDTVAVPLAQLETLLSPTAFLLRGRPGAIVPIRKAFADDLIGGSRQLRLVPSPEAALFRERVYFSSPKSRGILTTGSIVLFYESQSHGGTSSVIGAARIVRSEVALKNEIFDDTHRQGVLSRKALDRICLSKMRLVTTIDNILQFSKPVRLARLRQIGACDGANLVTARRLGSDLVAQIMKEGMT